MKRRLAFRIDTLIAFLVVPNARLLRLGTAICQVCVLMTASYLDGFHPEKALLHAIIEHFGVLCEVSPWRTTTADGFTLLGEPTAANLYTLLTARTHQVETARELMIPREQALGWLMA